MGDGEKGELVTELDSYEPGPLSWKGNKERLEKQHAENLARQQEWQEEHRRFYLEKYGPYPVCYQTGPDEINPVDWHGGSHSDLRFSWVVYHYENPGYEGGGDAVARATDGTYWKKRLGHCSCYWPVDNIAGSPWEQLSIEQLLALLNPDNALEDMPNEMRVKLGQVLEMDAGAL